MNYLQWVTKKNYSYDIKCFGSKHFINKTYVFLLKVNHKITTLTEGIKP